jgi:hypothetical protein
MATDAGYLYPAQVMHRRLVPPLYRFVYRLFYLLLDIDRIGELASRLRFFSHNRFNLLSFHDRDHGDGQPGGLRAWVERLLEARGIQLEGGRIRLLALPRVLGFVFNPISLFYCEHRDGGLRAVIAEVRNTFGERHCYILAPGRAPGGLAPGFAPGGLASSGAALPYNQPHEKDKRFHVSPLFDMVGRYRFTLSEPGETIRVLIHETREGVPILDATLAGERHAITDRALFGQVCRMPWMTLKVVAGIHWEALKIWLRGARYVPKPPPPIDEVS